MKYYVVKNETKAGPFTIDELKIHGLKEDSLIWHEGLEGWIKAKEINELSGFFNYDEKQIKVNESNPKKWTIRAVKVIVLFILFWLFIVLGIVQMVMQERQTIPALWMFIAFIVPPFLTYSKWADKNIFRRNN